MPGPGSGIPESEFKRLHKQRELMPYAVCDICGWRPATTVGPRGQLDYEPLTCQQCADELREMESGA